MLWRLVLALFVARFESRPLQPNLESEATPTAENQTILASGNLTTTIDQENTNLLGAILDVARRRETQKTIDPSRYISLKKNDWRDAHEGRMIIWSHESQYHPDYGRTSIGKRRTDSGRLTRSSQLMSFMILGSVIGFIMYTYVSHVILVRKQKRQTKTSQLRELVHRSALIMAGSAQQNEFDFTERRRSLINMFKAFKL